ACVLAMGHLVLVALLALLQSATAAPQVRPPERGGAIQAAPPPPPPAVKGAPVQAAPPATDPGPENEFTDAITLPTDRTVKKRLEAARDNYIQFEAWSDAANLLQRILDSKEDVFVQVRQKNEEKVRWVSAKAEANRLLGTM